MEEKVVTATRIVIAFTAVLATTLLMLSPFGGAAPAAAAAATGVGSSSNNNCTRICGNISVPYPFGVEPGCYHAAGFNLTCKQQHNHHDHEPTKLLFLGDGTVQVLNISVEDSTVRINSNVMQLPYNVSDDDSSDDRSKNITWGLGLPEGGPFFLSESTSMLEVLGCGTLVSILGGANNTLISSCTAICPVHGRGGDTSNCTGIACCLASITVGYSFYTIQINLVNTSSDAYFYGEGDQPTISAYIVDQSYNANNVTRADPLPATLDWIISTSTCPTDLTAAPECLSTNSYCEDFSSLSHGGYRCKCCTGYQGNPYVHGGCKDIDECKYPDVCYGNCTNIPASYICQCGTGYTGDPLLPDGCTDIDECEHQEAYSCYGICQNFPGSFHCHCPEGTYGNPFIKGGCITIKNSFTGLSIGLLGVGGAISLLLLALGGHYTLHKIKLQKKENWLT